MHASPGMMRVMSAMMRPLEAVIRLPESYTSEGLRVLAGVTYYGSNEKARRELGFAPRPIEEGLRETLHYEMKLLGMPIPA
jgi:nucleoside-diphosphate-sugar epimerase